MERRYLKGRYRMYRANIWCLDKEEVTQIFLEEMVEEESGLLEHKKRVVNSTGYEGVIC